MNIKKYFNGIGRYSPRSSVLVALLPLLISAIFPSLTIGEDSRLDILRVEVGQMDSTDRTKERATDFYLNGGEDIGVSPSMVLAVYRDKLIRNTLGDNISVSVPVGQLKVLKTYKDIAIARIESLTSVDTTPVLEYRTVMLGDYAVLQGKEELPPDAGVTVPAEVLFSLNKWELKAEAKKILARINNHYNKAGDKRLIIEGHTCSLGPEKYNKELSDKRARSVRDYLLKSEGLPPGNITIESYGENRPVASNATKEGRAQNRRVNIRFLPPSK